MNDIFELTGMTQETFTEAKAEPTTGGFLWNSGAYKVDIKEAAVFNTESGATMLKLILKDPETDKELKYFTNTGYLAKADKDDVKKGDKVENKGGTKTFKSLLSALHIEPTALVLKTKDSEGNDLTIEAYGKKGVKATIIDLEGRGLIALVREVDDSANSDKYPSSNDIEGFADVEGKIDGSTEPLDKWKVKIEKAPALVKKAKKGGAKQAVTSEEIKKAAKAILSI